MQEEKGIVDASGSSQENIKTVSKEESTKTPKPSKMENKKNIHRGVKRGRDIRGRAKRSAKSKSKHRNAHGAPIADSPDGNLGVGTPEDQEVAGKYMTSLMRRLR